MRRADVPSAPRIAAPVNRRSDAGHCTVSPLLRPPAAPGVYASIPGPPPRVFCAVGWSCRLPRTRLAIRGDAESHTLEPGLRRWMAVGAVLSIGLDPTPQPLRLVHYLVDIHVGSACLTNSRPDQHVFADVRNFAAYAILGEPRIPPKSRQEWLMPACAVRARKRFRSRFSTIQSLTLRGEVTTVRGNHRRVWRR
jgi:hypothetical protein